MLIIKKLITTSCYVHRKVVIRHEGESHTEFVISFDKLEDCIICNWRYEFMEMVSMKLSNLNFLSPCVKSHDLGFDFSDDVMHTDPWPGQVPVSVSQEFGTEKYVVSYEYGIVQCHAHS